MFSFSRINKQTIFLTNSSNVLNWFLFNKTDLDFKKTKEKPNNNDTEKRRK